MSETSRRTGRAFPHLSSVLWCYETLLRPQRLHRPQQICHFICMDHSVLIMEGSTRSDEVSGYLVQVAEQ